MKLKKTAAVAVAALLAMGMTACGGGNIPEKPSGGESGITSNFTVDGNKATVRWKKCEDASGYSVEKSSSRYGEYEYLDYVSGESAAEYETDDVDSYYRITAFKVNGESEVIGTYSYETELFGNNTFIYSPDDDAVKIQEDLDSFYNKTDGTKEGAEGRARGEFSEERFAALFKAGVYDIDVNMGYYTSLSGLGLSPDSVTISKINADAEISLCNFWRTAENLAVSGNMLWSVSQATSLRRMHVKGDLSLSGSGSTSGGFLADVKVDGVVNSGSQQQWFSRNSTFGGWSGGVWNMAFAGVEGTGIPENCWDGTGKNYTNIENCVATREKPFLTYDDALGYRVFVPDVAKNSRGVSWGGAAGASSGSFLSIDKFYVARSDRDTAETINKALSKGKNLILTAGIYELDSPLNVKSGTVVLGLGLATLRPSDSNSDTLMRLSDTAGICIGGVLFDAGKHTETLLEAGAENGDGNLAASATLSDLFFRVGGAKDENTSVNVCVKINGNNVIGDNFWIWRADHWDGVGWNKNTADTGIIINGDNATFYGLFVEHFQKYQTVWNGDGGTTYFYQSELPYDVPDAASWSPDGVTGGYASYYVSDNVTSHTAYALGVYAYLRDAAVRLGSAIVCPDKAGIEFYHMVTVWLSGNSGSAIDSIINGAGETANNGNRVQCLEQYIFSR